MFMQMFSLKFMQRVTILQTVSNQEVSLKRLISMLPIAQKLYSYHNVAKCIGFLDKKAIFVYTGKNSCKYELLKDISL